MQVQLNPKGLENLSKARAYVRKRAPYMQSILYSLIPYHVPGLDTMGVSSNHILIVDLDWLATIKPEEAGSVLMHEIMHIVRGMDRIERLASMGNGEVANVAADLPINIDLRTAKWPLPPEGAFPEKYGLEEGLTMEEYYIEIMKKAKAGGAGTGNKWLRQKRQQHSQGKGGGGGKKGKSQGKSGGKGQGKSQGQGGQGQGQGKDPYGPSVCDGKCGGVGGNPHEIEEKINKKVGRTKAERQRARKQTIRDIKKACESDPGRGDMPASLKELIDFEIKPKPVPWRRKISTIARRTTGRMMAGRSDYSLKRPSKRSFISGILRPGMIEQKPVICFIEDSSGSMGHSQLKEARSQVANVFKQIGISEAWFMDADTEVSAPPQIIRMRDLKTIPVTGRGGTDFCQPLEIALSLKPRPDIVIYLTDGDGGAPKEKPKRLEVIWCIVPASNNRKPANWGYTILCSDDQQLREAYDWG